MKTVTYLILFMCTFWVVVYAESYRKTAGDMYMENYAAQMRKQVGYSAAETRAEDYRARYEKCDEHHNCTDLTALAKNEAVKKDAEANVQPENGKSFIGMPVWQ